MLRLLLIFLLLSSCVTSPNNGSEIGNPLEVKDSLDSVKVVK